MSIGSPPYITWELIDGSFTSRAKVIGGWLIKYEASNPRTVIGDRGQVFNTEYDVIANLLFLPDPLHQWDAENTLLKLIENNDP